MSIVWGIRWDRRTNAALLALAAGLVAAFSLHTGSGPAGAATDTTVLVRGSAAAEQSIVRAGGTVDKSLAPLGMIVARLPRDSVASLRKAPGVSSVVADTPVHLLSDDTATGGVSTTLADVRDAIAANGDATAGSGVDVALIDSGTVPLPALSKGLVGGPDFSADAPDAQLRGLDAYGHGTHLGGIIAGNDPATGFQGIAPGARVVSLKVATADGSTSLVRMLRAIAWTIGHKNDDSLHIRVLNLSFGVRPESAYTQDLLAFAAEKAWQAGIAVVVSAGNTGDTAVGLDSPAYDPYVIAVGADDLNGTAAVSDDAVPSWSSRGGDRGPDVVAPGRAIVSLRVPNSYLDLNHVGARVSETLFRGSGTSQAAGVVSGAAAVLIAQRPSLTPDQVKALLVGTADAIPGATASAEGAGRIDVAAAAAAAVPAGAGQAFPQAQLPSDIRQALQSVKQGRNPAVGANGSLWSGSLWSGSLWSGSLWNGSLWSGSLWSGSLWSSYPGAR